MKITTLSLALLGSMTLGLNACGGGGSSDTKSDTETTLETDTPASTTKHTFDGIWKSICDYDADSNEADQLTATINGNVNTLVIKDYKTSDCSGVAFSTVEIALDTQYKGDFPTSSCIAEKVDLQITAASINGTVLNAVQIAGIKSDFPPYQLVCIDSNSTLRFGDAEGTLNGTTPEKRPTTMMMEGTGLIKQ